MTTWLGSRRAVITRPREGELYRWGRITAGAALLDALDPGWWREGATPSVDLAALNMADTRPCLLGQRFTHPAPAADRPRLGLQPYETGLLILGVLPGNAAPCGFTGADAGLLTAGWRHLVISRRAASGSPAGSPAGREPACPPQR